MWGKKGQHTVCIFNWGCCACLAGVGEEGGEVVVGRGFGLGTEEGIWDCCASTGGNEGFELLSMPAVK